ncbi:MAG: hypothetical protein QW808_04685 [Desulfurococcaceae archaeon]
MLGKIGIDLHLVDATIKTNDSQPYSDATEFAEKLLGTLQERK